MPRPILLAGLVLALSSVLPREGREIIAILMVIALGVPHGALDGELARTVLRPRFRRAWFAVFSVPYLVLFASVLLSWRWAPLATLGGFLTASAWHFGAEEQPASFGELLVRGGLPIAVPVLVHPGGTMAVFAAVAGVPIPEVSVWLRAAAVSWLFLALGWGAVVFRRVGARRLAVPGLLAGCCAVLPPLTGFAVYFVCFHAPAHVAALIGNRVRAPRVRDQRAAWLLAMPVTGLTLLIGAGLWPFYGGVAPERLVAVTIQVLSALTLPHMLFEAWLTRRERRLGSVQAGPAFSRQVRDLALGDGCDDALVCRVKQY